MVGVEPPAAPAPTPVATAVAGRLAARGVRPRKVSAKRSWPPGCGRFPAPTPAVPAGGGGGIGEKGAGGAVEGGTADVVADAPAAVSAIPCDGAVLHPPNQPERERVVEEKSEGGEAKLPGDGGVRLSGGQGKNNGDAESSDGQGESNGDVPLSDGQGESNGGVPLANGQEESNGDVPLSGGQGESNGDVPLSGGQGESNRGVPLSGGQGESKGGVPLSGGQGESKGGVPLSGGQGESNGDGGVPLSDDQGENMVINVMPLAFAAPQGCDVVATNGSMENGGGGACVSLMEGKRPEGSGELIREEEFTGHGHDSKEESRVTAGELNRKKDGHDGSRKKRWLMSDLNPTPRKKRGLMSDLNPPPKRRPTSAIRRFPPGCGRAAVTLASSRDVEGLLLKNKPISIANGSASVGGEDLGTVPVSSGCASVVSGLNSSNVEVDVNKVQDAGASKANSRMQDSQVTRDDVPNDFEDAKHVSASPGNSATKASPNSLCFYERMNRKRSPHEGKYVAREVEDSKVGSKQKVSFLEEGEPKTPTGSHIMKNMGNRLEVDKTNKALPDDVEASGEGKMRSETMSSKRGSVCSTSDMKQKKVAHTSKSIGIVKDNLHRSDEKSKFGKHVVTNQTKESDDLDLDTNRIIVQALMAPDRCPWGKGRKSIVSVSESRTPRSKLKNKKVARMKELSPKVGSSKLLKHEAIVTEDDEGPYSEEVGNSKALVMHESLPPRSKSKNKKVARMEELSPKVGSSKLVKHEAIVTEDDEDSYFEDDENPKALVMHKEMDEFCVTLPPCTPSGDHGSDARSRVRKLLKLFHGTCRKLTQVEEKKIGNVGRIDIEATNYIKKSPLFTKLGPIVGNVPGIEIGDEFHYRVELSIVGLHRPYQAGIDTTKVNGVPVAISIVASGGYPDELSSSDELIYTGSGGKAAGKKEAEDQKLERGNLALKNCIETKTPVRVIHGLKGQTKGETVHSKSKQISTYTYDGLYMVVECWREGPKGSMVFKYKLQRIQGQPELALHVVKATKKVKIREGLCLPDISQGSERIPICAINTIDDLQPAPFKYIREVIYPHSYAKEPPRGCDCTNGCSDSKRCACAVKNGGEIPFNSSGAIVQAKALIYECGPLCRCPPSCHNRVSQHGIKIPLEIFKTGKTGWGVRSLSSISSGSFVCEYAGELLEDKEAEERQNNDEYLFDIGHNYDDEDLWEGLPTIPGLASSTSEKMDDDAGFTIDAAECGNVGRFINHSCSPNLYAQNVLWDHDEKRMPHIMFFAAENIKPLEELTYHYNYTIGQVHKNNEEKVKHCYCGSADCCGRLY